MINHGDAPAEAPQRPRASKRKRCRSCNSPRCRVFWAAGGHHRIPHELPRQAADLAQITRQEPRDTTVDVPGGRCNGAVMTRHRHGHPIEANQADMGSATDLEMVEVQNTPALHCLIWAIEPHLSYNNRGSIVGRI